ncbi:MAG TPA: glycosyltransferase 87 family protein [Puia sp.]|jgi:hypothetical protein
MTSFDLSPRALLAIFAALVIFCVMRDSRISEHYYGSDLRNRVVGARLEKDGRSPYFYKWHAEDGLRYYDPDNDPGSLNDPKSRLSNITASPFFHHLLSPVADLPQMTIYRLWLIPEYLILIGMTIYFFVCARTGIQKTVVLTATGLFLFTLAWHDHVLMAQYYLLIPFLALVVYGCMRQEKSLFGAAIAGAAAITLVLIRPNCILIFLPFLLLYRRFSRGYRVVFSIPVVLLLAWTFADGHEQSLWKDYRNAIMQHSASHLQLSPFIHCADPPACRSWEGVDTVRMGGRDVIMKNNENGNFFLLFKRIYKPGLNLFALQATSAVLVLGLLIGFYFRHRRNIAWSLPQVAIAGYCLYMISDLFSPVYRWQYYTVQWLFPVLLAAAAYHRRQRWAYLLLLAGLVLNILNIQRIGVEHSIGEYIMLGSLVWLAFSRHMPSIYATAAS